MANAFFSYAGEDQAKVDAVYATLIAHHPQHEPWVAHYEIVAGQSLIAKVSAGIDEAEKFFVFLSEASVNKPWVEAELRSALADEIAGVRPDFVVPVLLERLQDIPRFLKDKLYIDLSEMTQPEWVAAFDAAITGTPGRPEIGGSNNLVVTKERGAADHIALVRFKPKAWAERFSFFVETSEDMIEPEQGPGAVSNLLHFDGASAAIGLRGVQFQITKRVAALRSQEDVRPGEQVAFKLEFPKGTDALRTIEAAGRWE
jgi:hypothetical protein